jgi:hypothetical protein
MVKRGEWNVALILKGGLYWLILDSSLQHRLNPPPRPLEVKSKAEGGLERRKWVSSLRRCIIQELP